MVLPSQAKTSAPSCPRTALLMSLQHPTTPQVMAWPKERCKLLNINLKQQRETHYESDSKFLFTDCITPYMIMGIAPAQLLMNRRLRSHLIVCFRIYNNMSRRSRPSQQLPTTIPSCYGASRSETSSTLKSPLSL